ncbi:MAG: cation-translocating P-type ATPase [Candidatus Bathyarchaeota archaeon]|nr:cation-translocating P-type ATPase [Candidatus Bathyarchaeota archaeon]
MHKDNLWHALEINEVLKKLATNTNGLSREEAERRLEKYGFNEFEAAKRESVFRLFLRQFKSILIMILLGAIALSLMVGEHVDAVVISVIVAASILLGFSQEYRAERALEALKRMLKPMATVIRDGKETVIPAREIVPGDIIVLREGDKVPADARLIEAIMLQVNEAPLTGESVPVTKETGALPKDVFMSDRKNLVFAGTEVTYGKGKAVVVATGINTEFGKIAAQITGVVKERTPLEERMAKLGKWLGILAIATCITVVSFGLLREFLLVGLPANEYVMEMVFFGVALAVATVPEALPAVVTGTLAIGMYRMAKKNALVRRMAAVETLGCTTVICSDKTGTLTKGEMTVREIYIGNETLNVTGVGYEPTGEIVARSSWPNQEAFSMFMKAIVLCNDAELTSEGGRWLVSGDPTEGALLVAAAKANFGYAEIRKQYPRIGELPFSSERKRMTTIHSTSDGHQLIFMKGASEVVLERCTEYYGVNGIEKLTQEKRREILDVNEKMASKALRVLGVAYKSQNGKADPSDTETIESNMIFLGLVGMIDPPREEAIEAVKVCKKVGIKPIMITGDHKLTAVAIAKELGIYQEGDVVLTGEDLEHMTDEELEKIVEKVTVYARVSPAHKLKIVKAWKKKGQVVAMTGDGVNDAPALKQADIGVAMGITGTEVSKEASDIVLADDNFATIVTAIELGRWIFDNIKKYLTYLLQCNLVEIIVLSITVLLGYPLPLLPTQILYINLATDGLPAIALGVSPPDRDIMNRPPRKPKESIFTKEVKLFLLLAIVVQSPILLGIFLWSLPHGVSVAQTRLFLVFVFFEIVLALNCRSLKHTIFEEKPHKALVLAVAWEVTLILVLVNVPAAREALKIVFPGVFEFMLVAASCAVTFLSMELLKYFIRKTEILTVPKGK